MVLILQLFHELLGFDGILFVMSYSYLTASIVIQKLMLQEYCWIIEKPKLAQIIMN